MSVALLQPMSIDMFQVVAVALEALGLEVAAEEMVDDQVHDASGAREMVEEVAESVLLKMEDQRRHKRSSTQRWRITGAIKIMVQKAPRPWLQPSKMMSI
jgi:hypothetical protein